jgi:hypothetical protein
MSRQATTTTTSYEVKCMPELLPDGLPERASRTRFDFSAVADGQVWKFIAGVDYTSSLESFRYNVRRWARAHGYVVETRPVPAADDSGRPLPPTEAAPVGVAVRFKPGLSEVATTDGSGRARPTAISRAA